MGRGRAHGGKVLGAHVVHVLPPGGGATEDAGCYPACWGAGRGGSTLFVVGAMTHSRGAVGLGYLQALDASMAPVPPPPPPPPPQAPPVGAVVSATATMANGGGSVDADVEAAAAATTAVAAARWTVLVSDAHAAAGAHWDVSIERLLRWWCREVQGGTLLVDA